MTKIWEYVKSAFAWIVAKVDEYPVAATWALVVLIVAAFVFWVR